MDCTRGHESAYLRGGHLGQADYFRRWVNQESIRERDEYDGSEYEGQNDRVTSFEAQNINTGVWDLDGNLAHFYFRRALHELPRLQHIAYGDYRALAYDGETCANLCRRLFDRTVCPSVGLYHPAADDSLQFRDDLIERRRTWMSLSICHHPFETSCIDQSTMFPGEDAGPSTQRDVMMNYEFLFEGLHGPDCPTLQVRSLKLPVLVINLEEIEQLGRLPTIFGPSLSELDLGTISFSSHDFTEFGIAGPHDILRPLLVPPQPDFTSLKSVTLRGFLFGITTLREFLLR